MTCLALKSGSRTSITNTMLLSKCTIIAIQKRITLIENTRMINSIYTMNNG
jgi:hypothetical protein